MKGDKKVIERLNEALTHELGAVNQYWLHYRLLEDWGFTKLAKKEREMARIQKKMMKEAFSQEFSKRAQEVLVDDVGGKSVFRF